MQDIEYENACTPAYLYYTTDALPRAEKRLRQILYDMKNGVPAEERFKKIMRYIVVAENALRLFPDDSEIREYVGRILTIESEINGYIRVQ